MAGDGNIAVQVSNLAAYQGNQVLRPDLGSNQQVERGGVLKAKLPVWPVQFRLRLRPDGMCGPTTGPLC